MKDLNFEDVLALAPDELRAKARSTGWALSAVGGVVYSVLRLFRQTPKDFLGICPFFTVGKNWGGVSFGWFFVCGANSGHGTKTHEVGHIIQNAKVGGFKMLCLSIGSAVRYWKRKLFGARGSYDSWWFEGQATALGVQYVTRIQAERDGGESNE